MQEIIIISQYFYPSSASTAQLMSDLAKGFLKRGYSVKVFTSGQLKSHVADSPSTQLEVVYSPYLTGYKHSITNKIANSLLFLVYGFVYVIFRAPQNTPLLIASNPPYSGIVGLCFRLIKQGKFYFLLQDIFPESAVLSNIIKSHSFIFKVFSHLTYLTCKYSQNTVVLSDSMKFFLEKKYFNLNKRKVNLSVIENWSIESVIVEDKQKNGFAVQYDLNEKFTVLYSGNIGRLHDIESVTAAALLLNNSSIQFVFIGDGFKRKMIECYIQEHHLKNILLLPFQPREVVPYSLAACDVSLVSLIKGADEIIAPCKLYGMLAAGRAVVAISSTGSYIDRLLTEYRCGVNCPPGSPRQLADTISSLAANPDQAKAMGKRARQLYEEKYSFSRALNEYEKLLFSN